MYAMPIDISLYSALCLSVNDLEFMGEWVKYCSTNGVSIAKSHALFSFWDEHTGSLVLRKSPNNIQQ